MQKLSLRNLTKKSTSSFLYFILLCCLSQTSFGQVEKDIYVFSEVTSHLRGNRSQNLSIMLKHKRASHSLGLDYFYEILGTERTLDPNKLSYSIKYQIATKLNKSLDSDFNIGLSIKASQLNMHQVDALSNESWYKKEWIYERSIQKITTMGIVEIQKTINRVFIGCQLGIGVAQIRNVREEIVSEYLESNDFKIGPINNSIIDFSSFYEHGYHRTDEALRSMVALQINLLVGYKF